MTKQNRKSHAVKLRPNGALIHYVATELCGWAAADLAERIDVDPRTVQNIFGGTSESTYSMSVDNYDELLRAINVCFEETGRAQRIRPEELLIDFSGQHTPGLGLEKYQTAEPLAAPALKSAVQFILECNEFDTYDRITSKHPPKVLSTDSVELAFEGDRLSGLITAQPVAVEGALPRRWRISGYRRGPYLVFAYDRAEGTDNNSPGLGTYMLKQMADDVFEGYCVGLDGSHDHSFVLASCLLYEPRFERRAHSHEEHLKEPLRELLLGRWRAAAPPDPPPPASPGSASPASSPSPSKRAKAPKRKAGTARRALRRRR